MAACDKCSLDYFQVIVEFYSNDTKSLSFLRSHCVLPSEVICPYCTSKCTYHENQHIWRCRKSSVIPTPSQDGEKVRAVFIIIFFYSVLFLVFLVHLELDLIVLLSESGFILVFFGGECPPPPPPPPHFYIYIFF